VGGLVDAVAPVAADGGARVELCVRDPVLRERARDGQTDRSGADEGELILGCVFDRTGFSEPPMSSVRPEAPSR
jgi:hypothetical protein